MLLRLCSYNLGLQATDVTKVAKLERLLRRLQGDSVDLVCLQETVPYAGLSYVPNEEVVQTLCRSPYAFHTGGNCSTGVLQGEPWGCAVPSFPQLIGPKYGWRRFASCEFTHAGHRVLVLNSHTRAGRGRHDTADSFSDIIWVLAPHAGRDERILCAWRAKIPQILQFFHEIFARISRDLDAGRALFRI